MRRLGWLPLLLLLSACSALPWPGAKRPSEAERMVGEAEEQVRVNAYPTAAQIFEEVVRRFPDSPVHDRALYGLARSLVLAEPSARDYRQAHVHFERLLREHPESLYAPDARAWRGLLSAYLARLDESERVRQEADRLRQEGDRLKLEAERLKQDIERLKKIDIEMERPRRR